MIGRVRYVMRFLMYSSHYIYLGLVTLYTHCTSLIYMMMMYVFHLYVTCIVSFHSFYTSLIYILVYISHLML